MFNQAQGPAGKVRAETWLKHCLSANVSHRRACRAWDKIERRRKKDGEKKRRRRKKKMKKKRRRRRKRRTRRRRGRKKK